MLLRFTLALLCLASLPCTVFSQVQIIQGPNGLQIVPQQQYVPPQQQYVPPQQQYVPPQQQYVPPQAMVYDRIQGGWVTPNAQAGINNQTGGIDTSNSQIADSAFANGREQGKANRRWVRRDVRDASGRVIGFQQGWVWNNPLTGQEHSQMQGFTPNNSNGIHKQYYESQQQVDPNAPRPGV